MHDDPSQRSFLPDLVASQEGIVNRVRKTGDLALTIESATNAANAIQAHIPPTDLSEEERSALIAVKRILFKAAADSWPGWSVDGAPATPSELVDALDQARRSAHLVEVLDLGKRQEGTAAWLLGALELALDRIADSLSSFARAEHLYGDAGEPALKLLAAGYSAVAYEAGARTPWSSRIGAPLSSIDVCLPPFASNMVWFASPTTRPVAFTLSAGLSTGFPARRDQQLFLPHKSD